MRGICKELTASLVTQFCNSSACAGLIWHESSNAAVSCASSLASLMLVSLFTSATLFILMRDAKKPLSSATSVTTKLSNVNEHHMGKYRDAVKAFTKAAERAKTPSFRDLATLCAALGELATGGTKGASKALDLAQPICRRHEDFLQNEEEKKVVCTFH